MEVLTERKSNSPWLEEYRWLCQRARPPRLRTMREFAEEEVIIPDGPFEGQKFKCDYQPYSRLWFDALDSGLWSRFVATGPTQTGKTLSCFVIVTAFHLFEVGETVICGLPDMDMASDKWSLDILPVVERSRYRDLLPRAGAGSRGGKFDSLRFRNGSVLKFMSGGGGDKSRAAFTSRVLVVTETDGMDLSAETSREADKITQLEARTRAFGDRKRIYMECTVTTKEGRTWREYESGTQSRIMIPCSHCHRFVNPEREHLVGWQQAETGVNARRESAFHCPACGESWTEEDRREANLGGKLVHRGQEIDDLGVIHGSPPESDTLGFRWSAANNLFLTAGDIGSDEWRSSNSDDSDNAERELCQFVWAVPHVPDIVDSMPLTVRGILERISSLKHGVVPDGTEYLTAGIDLGKWLCHWVVVAWRPGAEGHIVDYGRVEAASSQFGVEKGILLALREFRDIVLSGWPEEGKEGSRVPDQVWVDCGYMTDTVYAFSRESVVDRVVRFRPCKGLGESQDKPQKYNRPKTTGVVVKFVGEGYHLSFLKKEGLNLVEVNADHWKTWIHQRLSVPLEAEGALTLYQANQNDHLSFAKHLTAEKQVEEFIAGKGTVIKWERIHKNNHWLDALYNAAAAGHFCGVRLLQPKKPLMRKKRRQSMSISGSSQFGDRPFVISQR